MQLSQLPVAIERLRDQVKNYTCAILSKVACWANTVTELQLLDAKKIKSYTF